MYTTDKEVLATINTYSKRVYGDMASTLTYFDSISPQNEDTAIATSEDTTTILYSTILPESMVVIYYE